MAFRGFKLSSDDMITLEKLMSHSGISMPQSLQLEKNDINLIDKTIICKSQSNICRKATIRPDDLEWFKSWGGRVVEKLFPFSQRSIYYHFKKRGISQPYYLRQKLWDEMVSLKSPAKLMAVKFGYFVNADNSQEKSVLFSELQEFEEKHFGDLNCH